MLPEDSEAVADSTLASGRPEHSPGPSSPFLRLHNVFSWMRTRLSGVVVVAFPRYILPDDTPSRLPLPVTVSARLRLCDAQRWGLTPVVQGVRGQREGKGVHLYTLIQGAWITETPQDLQVDAE